MVEDSLAFSIPPYFATEENNAFPCPIYPLQKILHGNTRSYRKLTVKRRRGKEVEEKGGRRRRRRSKR